MNLLWFWRILHMHTSSFYVRCPCLNIIPTAVLHTSFLNLILWGPDITDSIPPSIRASMRESNDPATWQTRGECPGTVPSPVLLYLHSPGAKLLASYLRWLDHTSITDVLVGQTGLVRRSQGSHFTNPRGRGTQSSPSALPPRPNLSIVSYPPRSQHFSPK